MCCVLDADGDAHLMNGQRSRAEQMPRGTNPVLIEVLEGRLTDTFREIVTQAGAADPEGCFKLCKRMRILVGSIEQCLHLCNMCWKHRIWFRCSALPKR